MDDPNFIFRMVSLQIIAQLLIAELLIVELLIVELREQGRCACEYSHQKQKPLQCFLAQVDGYFYRNMRSSDRTDREYESWNPQNLIIPDKYYKGDDRKSKRTNYL
jgi:hypothetical protein